LFTVITVVLAALGVRAQTNGGETASGRFADPLSPAFRPHSTGNSVPNAGGSSAWITGPLVKVNPGATPGTQQSLQISAARNEFESFQVHASAGTNPIQMNVTVSDFVNAQTGDVISGAPTSRSIAKPISTSPRSPMRTAPAA
jgi:hypothetical protein